MSRDPFPEANDPLDRDDELRPLDANTNSPVRRYRVPFAPEKDAAALLDERSPAEANDSERTYYLRDRAYVLRESEFTTLVEIGRFRVLDAADLSQFAYHSNSQRMARDLRRLEQRGLLTRKPIAQEAKGSERLVVLTRKGKRLLIGSGRVPRGQEIYYGLVKPREAKHDAALYRLYQREAERISASGGRPFRIVLDYELKRDIHRELASFGNEVDGRTRQQVAENHGLVFLGNKIQIPDVRLEYETANGEHKQTDLELATRNYRPRALTQKAKAGFSVYAPREDASKLRRILDESELTAGIFAL